MTIFRSGNIKKYVRYDYESPVIAHAELCTLSAIHSN